MLCITFLNFWLTRKTLLHPEVRSWDLSLWCVKFIYSEKATKFCEIFTLLLSYAVPVKSRVKISQNFVAFSEYMNFNIYASISSTEPSWTVLPLIRSCIRTTHLCIMVILQNLKERNPPSLLENVISTRIFWDCEKWGGMIY